MQSNSNFTDQQRERGDRPWRKQDSAQPPCGRRCYYNKFHSERPKCRWGSCYQFCLQLLMPQSGQGETQTQSAFILTWVQRTTRTNAVPEKIVCSLYWASGPQVPSNFSDEGGKTSNLLYIEWVQSVILVPCPKIHNICNGQTFRDITLSFM